MRIFSGRKCYNSLTMVSDHRETDGSRSARGPDWTGGDPWYPNEIAAVGLLFAEPYANGRCGEEPPLSWVVPGVCFE